MGVDLYTLKKKAVIVLSPDGGRSPVHLLQLAVANALSPDAQKTVDQAIHHAYSDWKSWTVLPERVVQVGMDGIPKPGAPLFAWAQKRVFCFDGELLNPVGFLGNKELEGFAFRSIEEQKWLNDLITAREIDEGRARVYQDFWTGKTFQSGREFLAYRRGDLGLHECNERGDYGGRRSFSQRLAKIRQLIRLIEVKGEKASTADVQFLASLRAKAAQLSSCEHLHH